MSELNRATILGTGTMGPGMGAVLARAGLQVTLFDVNPEALERAEGMVGVVERRARPPRGAGPRRRRRSPTSPIRRPRSTDAEIVLEAIPEKLELKQRGARRRRGADLPGDDHRLEHLRHPDHQDRGRARAPRARDRLALVQPAAPDPDERGDQRRAHRARGHGAPSRS